MFSRLAKLMSGSSEPLPETDFYRHRLAIYESELGEPEHSFTDSAERRIDIHAFGRDFVPVCQEGSDEGYVLLTNGMSEQRMPGVHGDAKPRAELMWYVREPTEEVCANLRWLANLPFIDTTWFGFGHRVALPCPPVAGTDFETLLFLTPIIGPDKQIAEALEIASDPVEILTVNLISHQELGLIKSRGLDPFLDLLDENNYPPIFDPTRKSYV
ncbi:suppressor of fused domain protein [Bradyrhizobium barranii subsp. apii]|uniref:Suppressor of fused domain protein n=1 Tax=Bradyrhizobium barranii subsp. apii TaxID=2819348 RepID=A0A8T5VPC8_9BRAD|nr:suppressor of fused domain protein [Bradyrhizobium barranii]UPT90569.1 suppressor of fused domain protein [Bradyrhizobium barranii subsp. apii]UPT98559.1 suppressor of fused domain protein [Bradyrhizobium barranii subsp. apii]